MNRVRWGLVGATVIGREWMIAAIRAVGGEIVAVYSRDAARARAYATEFAIPHAVTELAALLRHDIDAVYIATTNDRHHDECLAAAAAGRHVLCEKPLALTLADAQAMVAACRRAGVVLATNHHLRNAAVHRAIRNEVQSGRLGRLVLARVVHGGLLPRHLQTWRLANPAAGAGAVLDLTVHDADLLRFVLDDEPTQVTAQIASTGLAQPGIEDAASGVIRFRSGLLASFTDSFNTPQLRTTVAVHGTAASIVARDCMAQTPGGRLWRRDATGETELTLVQENYYERGLSAFHAAIAGTGRPVCTGEDGVASLAVALAALQSAHSGTAQAIDAAA